MGRPAKSTAVHEKRGNPRRQKRPAKAAPDSSSVLPSVAPEKAADATASAALEPPSGLSKSERAIWDEVAAELHRLALLSTVDRFTLRRYCELTDRYRRVRKEVGGVVTFMHEMGGDSEGSLPRTTQRMKPAFSAEMQIATELRHLEEVLGLTRRARTAIEARRADTRDPERPANAAPKPALPANTPPPPSSPIGLLAGTSRGPVN